MWCFDIAQAVLCDRAARVKVAARRRVDRRGDLALEDGAVTGTVRIGVPPNSNVAAGGPTAKVQRYPFRALIAQVFDTSQ